MAAMDKTYAIIWTATQGAKWGLGTRRFSQEEAEALANQLNGEHGQFLHRPIDTASEDPSLVLATMRSVEAPRAAQIADFPDSVAAQAAATEHSELMPAMGEKLNWFKEQLPELPCATVAAA
jgi:hypothetical protein